MVTFEGIIYEIVRSRRRSISLQVDKHGKLIVRMPLRVPEKIALEFVKKKSDWIKSRVVLAQSRIPPAKSFTEGEEFLFLGKKYPLRLESVKSPALVLRDNMFCMAVNRRHKASTIFRDFYRSSARDIIGKMVGARGRRHGLIYKGVKITGATTRWGSCSNRGNLNFSWRLIMSPPEIIEYVVVHEMAHLKHANHSRRFWMEVKKMLPDYELRKKWLKNNGHMLTID